MDAVYIITMILPIVPDGMVKHFDDIFDSLLRLTQLAFYNKGEIIINAHYSLDDVSWYFMAGDNY